ncbi:LCP family protein [Agrococcus jejuensis]|uniref:Cell envelope-related function transcriptional attenuator common domain-containing protein n=1 Tax=Agrococcus jejuensis TaxID=399736 RepID=A0A1G8B8P3_9MICO|nr:LCP family protein [Agrococcus jejuensis]SDH29548.1 cell envelope-related function transcriptional attenuator common domain-containing protein [Agrococcus jejuensis]
MMLHAVARAGLRRRLVAGLAVGLVIAGVAVVGTTTVRVGAAIQRIERVPDAFPAESTRPAPHPVGTVAPRNYLLLGSDSRGTGGSLLTSLGDRADAILLVHVPADRRSVQIISIMRDSWVDIPGYGMAKINAALSYGGVPLMVQVVESLIGQRIDDVAIVDFAGFAALTDAVGGVTVQNEVAFSVGDVRFAQGPVTLTGADALPYVRERYAFADGDYQRVRNQQAYLRGLLVAMLQPTTLANPWAVAGLVDAMSPYLAATDGLTAPAAVQLAAELAAAGTPEVATFTLPTAGTATIGDQSVVLLDAADLAVVQAALQQDSMTGFVPPAER